jgi:thioredoxin 1
MEVELTAQNFEEEVIKSQLPVLVDFWAAWCGPCQRVAPYIEQLAKEHEGKLKVCKLNVDDVSDIASKYMVMSIPTFMIFKNGEVMEKKVGVMSKNELEKFIHSYI